MTETAKKIPRKSGRPKLPDDQKRQELRLFVSAYNATRLRALSEVGGVSEGMILSLLWSLAGEETWNASIRLLCAEEIDMPVAVGICRTVNNGIAAGKVKVTSTDGVWKLDGASVRAWILR